MARMILAVLWVTRIALYGDPPPLMDDYNRAWQLAGEGHSDEAIPLLKEIIAKDKTFHHAYVTLVEAYRQHERLDQADQYFRSLLVQDPGNGFAEYGLGEVSRLKKQHEAAAEHLTRCIHQTPYASVCYYRLVDQLAAAHNNRITYEDLKKRIRLDDPKSPYSYIALARMYRYQFKLAEAIQAAERGFELARSGNDDELPAIFEDILASSYGGYLNQNANALVHCQEALRIYQALGNQEAQVRFTDVVGNFYLRMGETARALTYLEGNLARARDLRNHRWIANAQESLGDFYAAQGDHGAAIESFRQSNVELRVVGTLSLSALQKTGAVYEAQGDLAKARTAFEDYRRTAVNIGERWDEAFALRRLADVERDSGEYFKSLQFLTQAVHMFREMGRKDNAGAGMRVMAGIYSALGDYPDAVDYYGQSLREAREIHDAEQQERIQLGLGELYLRTSRPKTALTHLEQALAFSEKTARTLTNLKARTLLRIGNAYGMMGVPERASAQLTESLRIAREIHSQPDEAQALIGLGELDLKTGNLTRAETFFRNALALAEPVGFAEAALAARRGLAEIFGKKGDYGESLRYLQGAVEAVESMRGRIPTPDLRSDFLQENWRIYGDAVDALSRLNDSEPASGYDRQAFNYAERGRARSFLDLLAESRAGVTKGLTSAQREQEAALLAEVSKASATLLRQSSDTNRQAVGKAEQNLAQWALELRETNPRYQELQYPEPDDASSIQATLAGTGAIILEYALGEQRSFLWAISEKQVQMVTLPGRQDIERAVATLRALASQPPKRSPTPPDTWQAPAHRLYQMLVAPVEKSLHDTKKILIIPDGTLYYLPFEALIRSAGGQPRYLIEDYVIAYAPSASVFGKLASQRNPENRPRPQELLAYGDPVFDAGQTTAGNARSSNIVRSVYEAGGIKFAPLPNTRAEVESIGRLYPSDRRTLYLGASATEASVKQEELTKYKRLHFATHAVIDEQVPARSGVVLSLINPGNEDGILRASEIFNLELDADLVVLSACQTGLGKLVRGEGMVGLTRAFLYAGTPRVVVSLWEVNDLGTADFMTVFYAKMKEGLGPGSALREAKLAMIHSPSPAYRYPFFWTPFVLVGIF